MATYRLDLLDFQDNIIEPEIAFADIQYSRTFGSVGSMVVTLPSDYYDHNMFGRDSILKLYRTPDDGPTRLEPSAVWFVRKISANYTDKTVILTCVDQMDLLRRRIVGYRQYSTNADKTFAEHTEGPADDLMRAYVRENMGTDVIVDGTGIPDLDRNLSDWIYVGNDLSLGPIVEQSGAFQRVSDVLDSLRNSAANSGVDLFYDMVVRTDGTFEFVTPISAPGAYHDLSLSTFTFNAEDGNLADLTVERDFTNEVTFVYVTCGGIDIGKHYVKVSSNRAELTPFNRIETHIGAEENNDTFLADLAYAALEAGKPVVRVNAEIIDSPFATYGRDFYYGDRVSVIAFGYSFDCYINSIRNNISGRGERLSLGLTGVIVNDPDTLNELEVWSARNYVHSTSIGGYVEFVPP